MNTTTFSDALLPLSGTVPAKSEMAVKPTFWTRLMAALMESRRRQAYREIARLELIYGFKLTDDGVQDTRIARAELPFQS